MASDIASGSSTVDVGLDRMGWDFDRAGHPLPDSNRTAEACAAACQASLPCKAWAFNTCGTPVCWLKFGVSGQSIDSCRTSGLIPARLAASCAPQQYRRWWNTTVPSGFPLPRSSDLQGLSYAEECAITYGQADTWFCSWGADDAYYCLFQDGTVNGLTVAGYTSTPNSLVSSGTSRVYGSSPFSLRVEVSGPVFSNVTSYRARYPSGVLRLGSAWYVSTSLRNDHNDYILPGHDCGGICVEGPVVSFKVSVDGGQSWTDPRLAVTSPTDNVFVQDSSPNLSRKVKFGEPHFVDHGQENQHSPDRRAYLVSHGSNDSFPGSTQGAWEQWDEGDQLYLARIDITPDNVNDVNSWEFWAGEGKGGGWVSGKDDGLRRAQPLFTWPNKTGSTFMTYVPALGKYLTIISTPSQPPALTSLVPDDVYILESEHMTGPFYLVEYLNQFGPAAYFPDFPSKFLDPSVDLVNGEYGLFFAYSVPNYSWDPAFVAYPKFSTYAWNLLSSKLHLSESMLRRLRERELKTERQ